MKGLGKKALTNSLDVFLLYSYSSLFSLLYPMLFYSFYTPTESSRQYKSQNSCTPYLKWMIIGKTCFSSPPHDWTFYVLQVKNKSSQEPTCIHTQATCYRLTMWQARYSCQVFHWQAVFCSYKERANYFITYLERNLIRNLKGIINLNFYTWKTISHLDFKFLGYINTHE